MSRKPMVTRTLKATRVTVLALNIETAEPFNEDVLLARTYKDENAMLKATQNIYDKEDSHKKAVHVVDYVIEEHRYGMLEEDFIKLADEIKPLTDDVVED